MRNWLKVVAGLSVLLVSFGPAGPVQTAAAQSVRPGEPAAPAGRTPTGGPCQQPAQRDDDRWAAVDFSAVAMVARGFDTLLDSYPSYGGTYWHRDGGLRVRIANSRADTALAAKVAGNAVADTASGIVGGVRIEPTEVSLRDLDVWASQARAGLTHLPRRDILSVAIDELCQYVQVFVATPTTARLSSAEQSRYVVSRAPSPETHSRDSDTSPYYGGVPLWYDHLQSRIGTAICTAGYTMVRSGTRYLSTAGHCGSGPWYVTGDYVGSTWLNPFEDSAIHADVQLLAYMTYHSPIWWGTPQTDKYRLVTAKESYPVLGQPVWVSGGNSGLVAGEVSKRWDIRACYPSTKEIAVNRVNFWYGDGTVPGDSGAPVAMGNGATSRTDDVTALGIHVCHAGDQGYYTRVDTMEAATDSTLVLSAP